MGDKDSLHRRAASAAVDPANLTARVSVLLIEDHPLIYDGLLALFRRTEDFELVSHASDAATALQLARYQQPDIILLDIELGESNGLDLVNQLRRICPDARITVLTAHREREYMMSSLRLGVDALLQKDMSGDALLAALRKVLDGERVIGEPQVLTAVLGEFSQVMQQRERERYGLTDPEVEILRLAASGLNNKDIGRCQFWSEITVKRKMQDIYRKLEVKSRAQAVAAAIRLGFI
jgi:DNA-binding NarL/FixJ family response regulator